MNAMYKSFPPGWEHLKIPTSSRGAALAGLSLYAACRTRAAWAQRMAWCGVALFGPRILPGAARPWTPIEAELWDELLQRWRDELGPFDAVAGYQRTVAWRSGFAALLLRGGQPVAFAKLRRDDGAERAPSVEERALLAMETTPRRSFIAPRLLAAGVVDSWRYFCTSALPAHLHHPPSSPPLAEVTSEVQAGLATLPRPSGTPSHWQPMHGDLTPWNLRRSGGSLYLVDWEHAGWGPPHADEVGYRVAASLIGVDMRATPWSPSTDDLEAIRFWIEQASEWRGSARDDQYVDLALRTLEKLEERVSRVTLAGSHRRSSDASTTTPGQRDSDAAHAPPVSPSPSSGRGVSN